MFDSTKIFLLSCAVMKFFVGLMSHSNAWNLDHSVLSETYKIKKCQNLNLLNNDINNYGAEIRVDLDVSVK